MNVFYVISGCIAVFSTVMVISLKSAIHALLYLILSLLSVAVIFYLLGAPFVAALEAIIYAGAIMVLFVFAVMMFDIGTVDEGKRMPKPVAWIVPGLLAAVLLGELIFVLCDHEALGAAVRVVTPEQVGISLFGPYLIAVELASFLLLAGLVGAYHLGRRTPALKKKGGASS